MRATWVVYVGAGAGHELYNCITESDWYGPFTEDKARRLEAELNELFFQQDSEDDERLEATATPLEHLPYRMVIAKYRNQPGNK